ncbi:MAG: TetR/AcrR family transcriptional regulator [Microthrixaceae bacterium]|nr:TetR/AcrR family transcriptional regulator [Microthrixaceae bacterium]
MEKSAGPGGTTRDRIVSAAVAELVERGLGAFTTPRVAARAGLAQGTLFRHFPTKRGLLVAAVEEAINSTVRDYVEVLFTHLSSEQKRGDRELVEVVIGILWDAYRDERVLAAYEVRSAARTDSQLAEALAPVLAAIDVGSGDFFALTMPETFRLSGRDMRAVTRVVVNALQGRAFTRTSFPDPEADAVLLTGLADFVMSMMNPGPGHINNPSIPSKPQNRRK